MKLLLLLVAASAFASFTQPPKAPVQPPRAIAPVDSHIVHHPKTKPSSLRAKSSAASTDKEPSASVTHTPVPTVKPAAKTRKP